ncbi:MAG: Cna B-type domain-containing protein [Coriobacteriales bacterium]
MSVTTHAVIVDGQSDLTVFNSKSAPKVKLGVAAIKVHKTLDGAIPSDGSFAFRLLQQNPGHFYYEVAKAWGGDEGYESVRPKSVTAKLYANGVERDSVTLTGDSADP